MQSLQSFAGSFVFVFVIGSVAEASPHGYHRPPHQGSHQPMRYQKEPHRKEYQQTYFQHGPHHNRYRPTYYPPTPTPTPTPTPKPTTGPNVPSLIINSNVNTNSNNNTNIAAAIAYLLSQLFSTQTGNQNQFQTAFPFLFAPTAPSGSTGNDARQGEPDAGELPALLRQAELFNATSAFPASGTSIINLNTNSNSNINDLFASLFIAFLQLLTSFQAGSQAQAQIG